MKFNGFLFKAIRARNKLWFPCNPRYLRANTADYAFFFQKKTPAMGIPLSTWDGIFFSGPHLVLMFPVFLVLTTVLQCSHIHGTFLNWFTGWCMMSGKRKECTLWFRAHSVRFFDVLSCFSVPLSFAFHLFMMGTKWLVSKQVPGRLSKAPALNPRVLTVSGGISDSVDSPTDINIEVNRKVVFILQELVLRYPRKMTLP